MHLHCTAIFPTNSMLGWSAKSDLLRTVRAEPPQVKCANCHPKKCESTDNYKHYCTTLDTIKNAHKLSHV